MKPVAGQQVPNDHIARRGGNVEGRKGVAAHAAIVTSLGQAVHSVEGTAPTLYKMDLPAKGMHTSHRRPYPRISGLLALRQYLDYLSRVKIFVCGYYRRVGSLFLGASFTE